MYAVAEAELAAKKKTLHASERDRPAVVAQRTAWPAQVAAHGPARLIFLDECGVATNLTRRYARAPRGARAPDAVPQNWDTTTILGALSSQALVASMSVVGSCDTDVFLVFLDQVLAPALRPGDVVIRDNLAVHKVAGVAERLAQAKAKLVYLPPYSPDLNPIEKCWSPLKERLRTAKARTQEALEQALAQAVAAITSSDAQSWFTSCGYGIQTS